EHRTRSPDRHRGAVGNARHGFGGSAYLVDHCLSPVATSGASREKIPLPEKQKIWTPSFAKAVASASVRVKWRGLAESALRTTCHLNQNCFSNCNDTMTAVSTRKTLRSRHCTHSILLNIRLTRCTRPVLI